MIILITGSPCTGKSMVANKLGKLMNAKVINITDFVKENKLSEGYDEEKDCLIVDENKLAQVFGDLLKSYEEEDIIIEGHLAQFIERADICVVLRCDIEELYQRLKARSYSEDKIKENIEAEIFGICEEEARERQKRVVALRSSKRNVDALVEEILDIIKEIRRK